MTYFWFLSVTSVDPSLGRIDKASLSLQTIMELLIEGVTNKETLCGDAETPQAVFDWRFIRFDKAKELVDIYWNNRGLEGSISLQWLPPLATWVTFAQNALSGTVDLTRLPGYLRNLSLSRNYFSGTVDFTQLPPNLLSIFLYENHFKGRTDFSKLPKLLRTLNVEHTNLEGEVYDFDGNLSAENSYVKDMRKK